jgi:hypothetical protein
MTLPNFSQDTWQTAQSSVNLGVNSLGVGVAPLGVAGTIITTGVIIAVADPGVDRVAYGFQTTKAVWANGGVAVGATVMYGWNGRCVFTSPVDGQILLQNSSQTGFTSLQFGGTSALFPELKRSTTGLHVKLADDSAFTDFQSKSLTLNVGSINEVLVTDTYSASITPNAAVGNYHQITATNGTAFTINAPTNPVTGECLELMIRNTSGGALGVITWNAVFKMAAWTSPATANSRSIRFRYDGTNWVEVSRVAADIPN